MPSIRFSLATALGALVVLGCEGPVPSDVDVRGAALGVASASPSCSTVARGAGHYLFCDEPAIFEQAVRNCEAAGLTLATIDDAEENDFVAAHATPGSYIGLTDADREGVWRWQADDRVTWCGTHAGHAEHVGAYARWARNSPRTADCQLRAFERHDYWFCSNRMTWAAASRVCEGAGGQLATISSAAENRFLAEAAARPLFTGGRSRDDDSWVWVDSGDVFWGSGADPSMYANWSGDAPRPERGSACLVVGNGTPGSWRRVACDVPHGFVCEAPSAHDLQQPDVIDCAVVQRNGDWTSEECSVARSYVCENPSVDAGLAFADIASRVRDDFRTGRRLIDYAEISRDITAPNLFARFPEALGMRPCVDGFAESGAPRVLPGGFEAQDYQQTYRGVPVYTRGYSVRRDPDNASVRAINGPAAHGISVEIAPAVTQQAAHRAVEAVVGPTRGAPATPRLILYPIGAGTAPAWRLAWHFDLLRTANREAYTVIVGADTPDVLMRSGETEAD